MTEPQRSRDILHRAIPARKLQRGNAGPGRLVCVVIGVDHYDDPAVPDLTCAANDAESVSGAIRFTQPGDVLEMTMLTARTGGDRAERPTRAAILDAVRRAAESAGVDDTVFVYFAGHGGMVGHRPCLFPADVELVGEACEKSLERVVSVAELQDVFSNSPCRRRAMVLDCCQRSFSESAADDWQSSESVARALPWRTGLPLAGSLVDAFQQTAQGWALMLACGPNEVSLEDPVWGGHGIFSHFLATGLRGAADLDGDGVVSLPELLQYVARRVPSQAEAIIEESREREAAVPGQERQNPTMIWSGPITFPLTRCADERRVRWPSGIFSLWLRFLTRPLPYTLAVEPMCRYGLAVLYALAMALTVASFDLRAGRELPFWSAVAVGFVSALLWLANFALAGAANEMRWHAGGYVAGCLSVLWHLIVFLTITGLPGTIDPGTAAATLHFGTDLLAVLILMLIFGHNALHAGIALADLIERDLRVAGRRAFMQLERQWIHADIDNQLAMVSAHPKMYLALSGVITAVILVHSAYTLMTRTVADGAAVVLAHDFVLFLLVHWQVHWYAATYRRLRGILLPER